MTGQPRFDRTAWTAAVRRQPLDRPTRLVAGALAEHADRDGRRVLVLTRPGGAR